VKARATARMVIVLLTGLVSLGALVPASAQTLSWAIVPSPSVKGDDNFLAAVSCASAAFCEAVGALTAKHVTSPLIESWNGKRWTIAKTPETGGQLDAVSCASATACAAVGFTGVGPLAERWNGTRWSVVPSPRKRTGSLNGVSCVSATSCTAVGTYLGPRVNGKLLAESWNGTRWTITPTPTPTSGELNGISCLSATRCTAAGSWSTPDSHLRTLIESWNGTRWSQVASPSPAPEDYVLFGVSCPSARTCTAAGIVTPLPSERSKTVIETGTAGA
jgi:hypothetical protein